jgi:hypothetical protein
MFFWDVPLPTSAIACPGTLNPPVDRLSGHLIPQSEVPVARLSRFAILAVTLFFTCASFATTYYIAANGSDSNNGTSKTTPWLHAPGMTGCSANCAAKTPQGGDQFIFRGGDTWHHSASGRTPQGAPWSWNWSGTSGSRIYIGVDKTWFSGTSWARPKINGDNPLSTSGVSNCTYDATGFFTMNGNFVDFDNFEMLGACWSGPSGVTLYSVMNSPTHDNSFQNLYLHGWTHKTFSCSVSGGLPQGNCDGANAIGVSSHGNEDVNNEYAYMVIDGADSDPLSGGGMVFGGFNIHHSIFRNMSQGVVSNNTKYFHDNLVEFIQEPGDNVAHGNTFELNGSQYDMFFYNNLIRHIGTISTIGVNVWLAPGGNMYVYNNVFYDINSSGNWFDIVSGTGFFFYNNTFVDGTLFTPSTSLGHTINIFNNHFVGATSLPIQNPGNTPVSSITNIFQSDATASSQGYTATNNYAPTAANNATVGTGTNLTSSCSTLGNALCSDTTLGVGYDTVNHAVIVPARTSSARPSSSTWDVGAYNYQTSQGAPNPPTNLTVTVH